MLGKRRQDRSRPPSRCRCCPSRSSSLPANHGAAVADRAVALVRASRRPWLALRSVLTGTDPRARRYDDVAADVPATAAGQYHRRGDVAAARWVGSKRPCDIQNFRPRLTSLPGVEAGTGVAVLGGGRGRGGGGAGVGGGGGWGGVRGGRRAGGRWGGWWR